MKKILLLTTISCMMLYMVNAQNYALQILADGTSFYKAALEENLVSSFTIEGWVKFDGAAEAVNDYTALVDFRNASNQGSNALIFKTSAGDLTTSYEFGGWLYVGAENIVPLDEWVHVAVVVSGDDVEARFYINGEQTGTDNTYTALGTEVALGENIRVGAGLSTEIFRTVIGIMDEIRIWTVARSESEINDNKGKEIDPASAGLLMYYKCNEEGLDTLHDATGNGYDLAVVGADYEFVDDVPFQLQSISSQRATIINTYPNPVKNVLNLSKDFQNAVVRIYDITGQQVIEKDVNSSFIDVADFETGMYILEVKDGNNLYKSKFIKE